jgi:two-component system KDP operon response regulator KdpE
MICDQLDLGAANSRIASTTKTECSSARASAPSKKILVVDDDPVILLTLTLKLKAKGYEVITASEGSQAITITRKEKPDLMLLDVNFPPDVSHGGGVPWNGFVITQWLRRLNDTNKMPIIVISGIDKADYPQQASAVGATAFLRKPIDSQELLASIDTAFQRS